MSGIELQWQFTRGLWLFGAMVFASFCGLLLALTGNAAAILALFVPIGWLILLPYHLDIAIVFGTILFNSALIVPFVTGRPFLWEGFSVLGWSGLIVTIALREAAPGTMSRIRRNWPLYVGLLLFCAVLLITMFFRGVGLRVFGNTQMGGRIYFQQLLTAVFPLLFVLKPPTERVLVRLYVIQCFLSVTFIAADLIFAYASGPLFQLLNFVELPTDGLNFEQQAMTGGIRRFQSLAFTAQALMSVLWIQFPLSNYFSRRGFWLWPATFICLVSGLLSGHRLLIYFTLITLLTTAWAQRLFTVVRVWALGLILAVLYILLFIFSLDLPLSSQRTLSVIPGIPISPVASYDAWITANGRRMVRDAGWEESKKYRWLGRGFSKQSVSQEFYHDPTYAFVDEGIFYNGTVGTLVNLGIPGAVVLILFLFGGSRAAFRIIRYVRKEKTSDNFSRLACVIAGAWFGQLVSFIFLHGDSEFTMRTFALPAAILVVCDYRLTLRISGSSEVESKSTAPIRRVIPYAYPEPAV